MKQAWPDVQLVITREGGTPVLYVELDGELIAKRRPREPWIGLDPVIKVRGILTGYPDFEAAEIEFDKLTAAPAINGED
jgi:hypothetical protein